MTLALKPPYPPMEARSVAVIPMGGQWQYEPKWDGFRCLVFREGERAELQSKSGQPLGRYFPELVSEVRKVGAKKFVLDGEIVVPLAGRLSFDELLQRIHPAESRVKRLAAEYPAMLIIFDLLLDERGKPIVEQPLEMRRARLEKFLARYGAKAPRIRLSPATTSLSVAKKWFRAVGGDLDGLIAKRRDLAYQSGSREGMQKIKHRRTADCVVGGFRYGEGKNIVGSLLLGLYDEEGLLHHVGFTSSFKTNERERITKLIKPHIAPPGFTGRAPGGKSRWSTRRSEEWEPLAPRFVVEVLYDHFTGDRFRHGTTILRWRPDKSPQTCMLDQVAQSEGKTLRLLGNVS
jgi:ATP-dependent DNA ligase